MLFQFAVGYLPCLVLIRTALHHQSICSQVSRPSQRTTNIKIVKATPSPNGPGTFGKSYSTSKDSKTIVSALEKHMVPGECSCGGKGSFRMNDIQLGTVYHQIKRNKDVRNSNHVVDVNTAYGPTKYQFAE